MLPFVGVNTMGDENVNKKVTTANARDHIGDQITRALFDADRIKIVLVRLGDFMRRAIGRREFNSYSGKVDNKLLIEDVLRGNEFAI
jgi:hypothetical protein